jgi:hypothetical protein
MSIPRNIFMTMSDKNKLHPIFSKNIDVLKKIIRDGNLNFLMTMIEENLLKKIMIMNSLNFTIV